ncbi:NUDIX domain-containing protein [Candidatus Berkelbacteria bacterium]|nr:NUDIX domain-containing protein [Candidatus Berkelbacteria bacterium]
MNEQTTTNPATALSLNHAKPNKLFYVVANVVVYRKSDGRCLVLKRHEREKVHPGIYGVPGGKAEWGDYDLARPTGYHGDVVFFSNALENLLIREVREEAGIEITPEFHYLASSVFIRPDGIPVVLMKFCSEYASGEVTLEEGAFSDYAWVNAEEVQQLPCIGGIPDEVAQTIAHYRSQTH